MSDALVSKVTPVLVVDDVEPCAQFWEKLGYTRGAEVPHAGKLGFVILNSAGIELMYQSLDSITADDAIMGGHLRSGGSSLYVEVADLDAAVRSVPDARIVVQPRKTFYGMRETGVLDPGGNIVLFAQKTE